MKLVQLLSANETLMKLSLVPNAKVALKARRVLKEVDEYKKDLEEVRTTYLKHNPEIQDSQPSEENYERFKTFMEDVLNEEVEVSWDRPIPVELLEDTDLTAQDLSNLEALKIVDIGEENPETELPRTNRLKSFSKIEQA